MPPADTPITGVHHDSRRVTSGSVFVCLPGLRRDGHEFAARAVESGAALVVGERDVVPGVDPYLQVASSRISLAMLAAAWYDHPSRELDVIGVTGTNGKSSVTWMLESIARSAGKKAALMGTLGVGQPGRLRPQPFTTPEATEFQAELRKLVASGVEVAAVEVSSHGLEQRRTYMTRFKVLVFTNLTQDHLDFHQSMDRYAAAKNLLFRIEERGVEEPPAIAVVNVDDPHIRAILKKCTDPVLGYGESKTAQVRPLAVEHDPSGIRMTVVWDRGLLPKAGELRIETELLGSFQVQNLLAAAATGLALGYDPDQIARGLSEIGGIPGRMERVERGQDFLVVVDYAHTPDALQRAMESLRPFIEDRIILVFGCGGERDQSKRFRMGQVASMGADRVFLTDDNPRGEDPEQIRREVVEGLRSDDMEIVEIADRGLAIEMAIREASPGDAVLIAGKGHETVQIRASEIVPFDDRVVAGEKIELRLSEGGS